MRTLHQTLDLQHHRHTGKVLHHRHTSYRALAVIFVVSGLFMFGLNMANRAAAADFGVAAMVEAPIPSTPPIIASPAADATISGSTALVTGSCPIVTPQAVVSISIDNTPAGTSTCDSNNDFSVPISLASGSHQITATALTVTGQKGHSSTPIPIQVRGVSSAPSISISPDQPFVYAAGKNVTWTGTVGTAGQGIEFVHVDWGDNSQSNLTVQAGSQSFSHHYVTLTSHNILLAASTTTGATTAEQFAASTFTTYTPASLASTSDASTLNTPTILGLYGLYVSALAVTGIIWLEAKHAARQHAQQHMAAF